MFSKVTPLVASVLVAGGLALSASLPATADDGCRRLPSPSLVILIPDGGCDVTDPEKQPKVPDDVTVIRGGLATADLDKKIGVTRYGSPRGPLVLIIKSDL